MIALLILLAVLAGAASSVQSVTNGMLAGRVGLPTAVLISASVLAVGAVVFWFVARGGEPAGDGVRGTHWWLYLGGLYGLFIIGSLAFLFPRLGAGPTTAVMLASQLGVALLLDHIGLPHKVDVTPIRLLGAVLLLVGALLVLWPKLRAG